MHIEKQSDGYYVYLGLSKVNGPFDVYEDAHGFIDEMENDVERSVDDTGIEEND